MDLTYEKIYQNLESIFKGHLIDLKSVEFLDPWAIGMICLKAIENKNSHDKEITLPLNGNLQIYLKRMHFDQLMGKLSYSAFITQLSNMIIHESETPNVQEILHCEYRDDFSARLYSRIRAIFRSFGMNNEDEQRATAIVGELGNNVFDHNEGSWPTDIKGAIIIGQSYPKLRKICVAVADPGVGFLNSLRLVNPSPENDIKAIELGLSGVTGRIGERRGNGLKLIREWTLKNFKGVVKIHSGRGLVEINQTGTRTQLVHPIMGTLAEFTAQH